MDPPLIESDPAEYEGPQEPEQEAPKVEAPADDEEKNADEEDQ